MRHPHIRALYAHWHHLFQREGRIPERRAIEPSSLRPWLGDVFLLDDEAQVADFAMSYRLAGSRVCALAGRELAGTPFASGANPVARALRRNVATLGSQGCALVVAETHFSARGDCAEAETILLPLLHEGRANRRVLGARVVLTPREWIGLVPVTELRFDGVRVLRPGEPDAFRHDRPVPLPEPTHVAPVRVAHLTVIEGGKNHAVTQT